MVIMDKPDYTNKALTLLADTNTYSVLTKDPTTKLKNKLIQTLKDIKQPGGLSDQKYRKLYPTSAVPPSFMVGPKSTKLAPPQAHNVQWGSITYVMAKELVYIIKSLVGQSPHHLKNTQHFVQQIQNKRL